MTDKERLKLIGALAGAIRELSNNRSRAEMNAGTIFHLADTVLFAAMMPDDAIELNRPQIDMDLEFAKTILGEWRNGEKTHDTN